MPLKFTNPILVEDKITGKEEKHLKQAFLADKTVFSVLNKSTGLKSVFLWWQLRHFFGPEIENKILKKPDKPIVHNNFVIEKL